MLRSRRYGPWANHQSLHHDEHISVSCGTAQVRSQVIRACKPSTAHRYLCTHDRSKACCQAGLYNHALYVCVQILRVSSQYLDACDLSMTIMFHMQRKLLINTEVGICRSIDDGLSGGWGYLALHACNTAGRCGRSTSCSEPQILNDLSPIISFAKDTSDQDL